MLVMQRHRQVSGSCCTDVIMTDEGHALRTCIGARAGLPFGFGVVDSLVHDASDSSGEQIVRCTAAVTSLSKMYFAIEPLN